MHTFTLHSGTIINEDNYKPELRALGDRGRATMHDIDVFARFALVNYVENSGNTEVLEAVYREARSVNGVRLETLKDWFKYGTRGGVLISGKGDDLKIRRKANSKVAIRDVENTDKESGGLPFVFDFNDKGANEEPRTFEDLLKAIGAYANGTSVSDFDPKSDKGRPVEDVAIAAAKSALKAMAETKKEREEKAKAEAAEKERVWRDYLKEKAEAAAAEKSAEAAAEADSGDLTPDIDSATEALAGLGSF